MSATGDEVSDSFQRPGAYTGAGGSKEEEETMNGTVVWEIPGVARIRDAAAGGVNFEVRYGDEWFVPGYGPLLGMSKGQARSCRKALRRFGLSGHLRRSLLRTKKG